MLIFLLAGRSISLSPHCPRKKDALGNLLKQTYEPNFWESHYAKIKRIGRGQEFKSSSFLALPLNIFIFALLRRRASKSRRSMIKTEEAVQK